MGHPNHKRGDGMDARITSEDDSIIISSCGVEEFVYACYDAINVLGRGLPVADADSYGATTVPGSAGEEGFAGGEDLCASSISSRLNACVVADEDG